MFAACIATPDMVARRFAERRAAGDVAPGEQSPAPLYRALMLRELMPSEPSDAQSPEEDPGEYAPVRVPFVMSLATPDGAQDIVEQDWDLSRFSQNPIALYNHNSWSYPIGYWEGVKVEGGTLRGTLVCTPVPEHDTAIVVAGLLKAGALRAASVGFVPGSVTERSKFPTTHAYYADRGLVYGKPLLLECSVVNIPMHPDATNGRSAEPAPVERVADTQAEPEPEANASADAQTIDLDTVRRLLSGEPEPEPAKTPDIDALAKLLESMFPVSVS